MIPIADYNYFLSSPSSQGALASYKAIPPESQHPDSQRQKMFVSFSILLFNISFVRSRTRYFLPLTLLEHSLPIRRFLLFLRFAVASIRYTVFPCSSLLFGLRLEKRYNIYSSIQYNIQLLSSVSTTLGTFSSVARFSILNGIPKG